MQRGRFVVNELNNISSETAMLYGPTEHVVVASLVGIVFISWPKSRPHPKMWVTNLITFGLPIIATVLQLVPIKLHD